MAAILCKPLTALCDCCTKPLAGFVLVTWATELPLAVTAALGLSGLLGGCQSAQWLAGMLLAALTHLLASVYLARRVVNRTDAALRDRHSAWARISHLLCHDPWVALYLLAVAFSCAWLVAGSSWSLDGRLDDPAGCGPGRGDVTLALGLGWAHFFAAPTALTCALCCACCDGTDYAADAAEFDAKEWAEEAKKKKKLAEEEAKKEKKRAEEEAKKEKKREEEVARRRRKQGADDGDVEAPCVPPPTATEDPAAKGPSAPTGSCATAGIPIGVLIPGDGSEAVDAVVVGTVVAEALPPPVPPPQAAAPPPGEKARVY